MINYTFLEQYGHIDHFWSTALPQFEQVFISLSFFCGASDHKFDAGGGGKGSGQRIDMPNINKNNIPDKSCKTISSAKYRFKAPRKEAKKNDCLSILFCIHCVYFFSPIIINLFSTNLKCWCQLSFIHI